MGIVNAGNGSVSKLMIEIAEDGPHNVIDIEAQNYT
jgi:hypothetical protein